MKKIIVLIAICSITICNCQIKQNPLVILDSKILGNINDLKKEMEDINPNTISTVDVIKDSIISKKYGSKNGVIIITTKQYIIETFYKENIENSTLKDTLKSAGDLVNIGVVTDNPESKNQPYDELLKYIDNKTNKKELKKVAKIDFIKSSDAIKMNPNWVNGALEITAEN